MNNSSYPPIPQPEDSGSVPPPPWASPPENPPEPGQEIHGTPQRDSQRRNIAILIGILAATVLLVGGIITALIFTVVQPGAPSPTSSPAEQVEPTPQPETSLTPEQVENLPSTAQGLLGSGPLDERVEKVRDYYSELAATDQLWDLIENTTENSAAYMAFSFLMVDLNAALRFSLEEDNPAQEAEIIAEIQILEFNLLSEKPLGQSLNYTFSDGSVFIYDGDTGEFSMEEP